MTSLFPFEPALPEERVLGPLIERAAELVTVSNQLSSALGTALGEVLHPRLRAMNSYYTNKIEGQHTTPADIDRALASRFSKDRREARKQRLALAHMDAETRMEDRVQDMARPLLYAADTVKGIHRALYEGLPAEERSTDDGLPVIPGELRDRDVTAGRHLAPEHARVGALLEHWSNRYRSLPGTDLGIVGAACAHHRLLWIHPFLDGNGRVARLHTHLLLHVLGLTRGVWSPMRGLARAHETYYAMLNNADLLRRNDYDGRGPLSQENLVEFGRWFIETCIDQATFMRDLLDLKGLHSRMGDLLRFLEYHPWQVNGERSTVRIEALDALHYTMIMGRMERGRFMAITGLPLRTARRVLASLIDCGMLRSDTSRAPVAFGLPLPSLRFLFPRLWPEAEVPG